MKPEDFKDFFKQGHYAGALVMVQLKMPGTMLGQVDRYGHLELKTVAVPLEVLVAQAQAQLKRELVPEEVAVLEQRAATGEPLRPVPVLIGTLSQRGQFLVLEYKEDKTSFFVTLNPDDIQHVTVAETSRILT